MAAYCRALEMRVLAWSQNLTRRGCGGRRRHTRREGELLAAADVVSLHLVLSPRTRGIVGAAELAG